MPSFEQTDFALAASSPLLALLEPSLFLILLFSKALRFSIMGAFFAWDLLRLIVLEHRVAPDKSKGVVGFSTGRVAELPRSTLGRLACSEDGDLEFRYRILGFGPRRKLRLEKADAYRVGCGVLYPSILIPGGERSRCRVQFRLLPQYKGCEDGVRSALAAGKSRI